MRFLDNTIHPITASPALGAGTRVVVHPLAAYPDRIVRLRMDGNDEVERAGAERLLKHLETHLPDPALVRVSIQDQIRTVISCQKIGKTRHGNEAPFVGLKAAGTSVREELAHFIEGTRRYIADFKMPPDIVGTGNLVVSDGRVLLLDLNDPSENTDRKSFTFGSRKLEIAVNKSGYPVEDFCYLTLRQIEEELLGHDTKEDPLYKRLRDPQRKSAIVQVVRGYLRAQNNWKETIFPDF